MKTHIQTQKEEEWNTGIITNGVLYGKNRYLYLYDGSHHQFQYLLGEAEPSPKDIKNFSYNLQNRTDYCSTRNIPYLHMVFPSKPVFMPENIPDEHRNIKSLYLSKYQNTAQDNNIIYPIKELNDLKPTTQIFRLWDTHMSDQGFLATAKIILQRLGFRYDWQEFFYQTHKNSIGDLGIMLKFSKGLFEPILKEKFHILEYDNRPYLPGNKGNAAIYNNPQSKNNLRLLIFGDSFIKLTIPFLLPIFRTVIYIRSPLFQKDIIELSNPDFIITSNAERYLAKVGNDDDSASFLLETYGDSNYKPSGHFTQAFQAQLSARHHCKRYETWKDKLPAPIIFFNDFKPFNKSKQIETIDSKSLKFKSTGNDPWFLFLDTAFKKGKTYRLEVGIEYSINSFATIYFTKDSEGNNEEENLSEENKVTLPIIPGDNYLTFHLPSNNLGRTIRFDPSTSAGEFQIKYFKALEN